MLLFALALLVVLHPVWLQAVGQWFVLREDPRQADAVLVVGSDASGGGAALGAELVRAGYAPALFLIDRPVCAHGYCLRWSDLARAPRDSEAAEWERSLSPGKIAPIAADGATEPVGFREDEVAWERLRSLGVTRILLVTDEVQSRRAALGWRKLVSGHAEVSSVPCSARCDSVQAWWQSRQGLKRVWLEAGRFAFDAAAGRLW